MTALTRRGRGEGLDGAARLLPGLALSAALAGLALQLGDHSWVRALGLSGLSLAIVLGMALGHAWPRAVADRAGAGVAFSRQHLLRLGIVLYGLRLSLQDVAQVGLAGVLVDVVVVAATFALALALGVRWLKLDRKAVMLIGVGSSICGAAAVLATEPVVRGRPQQVSVAVATVVVFGTLATFLYPLLHGLNAAWGVIPGGAEQFGIYIGSTVHEVAQVVAAGNAVGPQAADAAVITKMVRVMLLAPFLLALSAWLARHPDPAERHAGERARIGVPGFVLGFVAVVLFNSLQWLPPAAVTALTALDNLLLAMAMAALGLTTHARAIRQAGLRPLLLALLLFAWLMAGGALLNRAVLG
ncbi:MAG TPA: YeiH family putative sulfate export transporter [Ottowia sp.]|uniref:YeiH family protein n=1 Tax=Ottowia sp. TaxID=1898956 RepID=UPI002BA3E048|nr:YeiH family putative sulfate export transporter [Ottowia sp.]HMN22170.1 YeiH family putative sulfate export transporter [Ottowia sp.]